MSASPVFVVSGSTGASGSRLTRTALAQFLAAETPVVIVPDVRTDVQLQDVVAQAAAQGGLIVHTLVDSSLRARLGSLARARGVATVDLIGPLLDEMARLLGQQPVEQPGLYRKLHEEDVKRIEAIEFAVAHDDGKRVHDLAQAEIVLTGVSRVGKTPLSMYLSTMGWKVANVPLVKGVTPPPALFEVDRRRVIGLTVEPGQLIAYRQRRGQHLGLRSGTYTDPEALFDELEFARALFRQHGFASVDMTDKPIEEAASEIAAHMIRRLALPAQ